MRLLQRLVSATTIGLSILGATSLASAATPSATSDLMASALEKALAAAHFEEPIVAAKPTNSVEDQALLRVLEANHERTNPEDETSLTGFLSAFPQSGWAPSLWTNLGLTYLHYGYYSRALDAWQNAWSTGKDATDRSAKAEVDRAVGELARLEASLGQNDKLAALFADIGKRPIAGSATEAIQTAREELDDAGKTALHLFNCGPLALRAVLIVEGFGLEQVDYLQWYQASPKGTNFIDLGNLADKVSFEHQVIFRKPGEPVPVPSVMHLKVGHFAAIVGVANGRYHIKDPVFPVSDAWMSEGAIDAESSGYFLVPKKALSTADWKKVAESDGGSVWGRGSTTGTKAGSGNGLDTPATPPCPNYTPTKSCPNQSPPPITCPGMCGYNILESTVSLTLSDDPVGYDPPLGPSVKPEIVYNQRQDSQPATFAFFNVSQKWTLSWLSYVIDDPTHPGASVARYMDGGSQYYYTGYSSSTGLFAAQTNDGALLSLTSQTPITYRLRNGDGSVDVYAESDGSTSYPRRVFLSQIIDPQGNALTFNYDTNERLTSLTDAAGRVTTLSYGLASEPLLVTAITDPFGRNAIFTYDGSGRLSSITDVIGITSSFSYDSNSLIDAMTTPYGTTSFSYTAPGTSGPPRFVDVTDPMGYHEREEWLEPAPVPDSDPSGTVPTGMPHSPANQYLVYRDSFHWDKNAYVAAGCSPTGGCDYSKARDRHFAHDANNTSLKSMTVESVKYPLENRVWFNYDGQTSSSLSGSNTQPIAIGRVLDNGSTQLTQSTHDTAGYYKLTQTIDPLGRTTSFSYPNHIDLAAITQAATFGEQQVIAQFIYNTHHRPMYYTDAANQTTTYTYNTAQQLTSATNVLGQKTSDAYNTTGDLTSITNANNETAATFTYDGFDRIHTFTDSEGWTITYAYDTADRVTSITYPDGTRDRYIYDKLDLVSYRDREERLWTYTHDADRRLTSVTDPQGQVTLYGYNHDGLLTGLTDPKSNETQWAYDVEGRLTQKTYPDSSTLTYTYETTTSRLKSVLDALGQTKQYSYALDDRMTGKAYVDPVNPTPDVTFAYDPYYPRMMSMTDDSGMTTYGYQPVGSLGALQLVQESSPLTSSTIAYAYDELGRLSSRTVAGAGDETFGYDALGRLISHASDLGAFALAYLGQTDQITSRQLASSTLATTWSYLSNSGDRRLSEISNVGLSSGQYSTYDYTTTPENFITGITETSDASAVYPTASTQTASYNNLNQITDLSGQTLTWDADGNLTADGARIYTWDAENRLVGIGYPGVSGKATAFNYDGFGRRVAITSTPAGGGSSVTTSYLWCRSVICQARNAGNAITREYLSEGEYVPGTTPATYYYGINQIGSVRRVFATTSSAPAFSYDPYGVPLQITAPLTDFNYAHMFYQADSGLNLTRYRAYDPVAGRWLSRDPTGEFSRLAELFLGGKSIAPTPESISGTNDSFSQNDFLTQSSRKPFVKRPDIGTAAGLLSIANESETLTANNLYAYVGNSPLNFVDPHGSIRMPPGTGPEDYDECIEECVKFLGQPGVAGRCNQGFPFTNCMNECLEERGDFRGE